MYYVHRLDSTNNPSIRRGLDLRWPATYTGSTQELAYEPSPLQKLTLTNVTLIVSCILNPTDVVFVPLNTGYTVSVRRTRLNILVLLTLALAGESPTCILHEGMHTP